MTTSGSVLPLWAAVIAAAASGPVLDAGFPDQNVWPLTLIGIGIVLAALIGRSAGSALLVGFIAGASFYLSHIQWASLFLGPLPMSALAVLEALLFAVGAVAIALGYRWLPVAFPGLLGRIALLPLAVAGLWTAREAWSSVWPYGGFAWGRVALSQSEGPFAPLLSWLGISGVSFVMVLLVALTIEAIRSTQMNIATRSLAPVGLAAIILVSPAFPISYDGELTVAAVQGNAKAGFFDQRERGDLIKAQLDATIPIFGTPVDVVIWPEGASEYSPLSSKYAARIFDYVSEKMQAPLIAAVVTERDNLTYNTSVLWQAGEGALDLYDKRHPIPFGEYIPDRAFWRPFAPDLIDLVSREYTPGTTDPVFTVDDVVLGVNICFDISDDQLMTDSIRQGAQVIIAQSNNADFGRTDESAQQLAIARVRALELGRTVINTSTVGISAIIRPDGTTQHELPWFQPGTMIDEVVLSSTTTPAALFGRKIEWLISGLGLGALIVSGLLLRATKRPRPQPPSGTQPSGQGVSLLGTRF